MKEIGTGRTRIGRFAAITIPATALSLGFGVAIVQGAVSASISSAEPFQVTSGNAGGDNLELSLREAAVSDRSSTNASATTAKKSALVTLYDGKLAGLCLGAKQSVPVLGTLGLTVVAPATDLVKVGDLDLSADSVSAGASTLPATEVGVAQSQLGHQSTLPQGYDQDGFGLKTIAATNTADEPVADKAVKLSSLNASAYGLTLSGGLSVSTLSIAPKATTTDAILCSANGSAN